MDHDQDTTEARGTTQRDTAYHRFIDYLFTGALQPGSMVTQRELCAALDVPLGPMREAIKRLEAEQLVTVLPQRGIRILVIPPSFIKDAFAFRQLVETHAAARYAEGIRDGRIDRTAAEELLIRTRVTCETLANRPADTVEAIQRLTDLDHEMHHHLVDSLDNRVTSEAFGRVMRQLRLSRLIYRMRTYTVDDGLREHVAVLTAVLDGDADAAVETLRKHLDRSRERALGRR